MHDFNSFLTLFRMGIFWGCSWIWGQKGPPSLKSITHILQWNLARLVILSLKKILKIYKSRHTAFEFCWNLHFFTENWQLLLYQEIQLYIAFRYIISNSFKFCESLSVVLINMVAILIMSVKLAALGILKIKAFGNKGYNVIILSRESNYM